MFSRVRSLPSTTNSITKNISVTVASPNVLVLFKEIDGGKRESFHSVFHFNVLAFIIK